MFIMACLIPAAQRIVVFSLDFSFIRIMAMFMLARIFMKKEYAGFRWVRMDTLFVAVWAVNAVVYTLQWGTIGAAVNRLGIGFEAMGVYFLGRVVIQEWEDLLGFIKLTAMIAFPVALFFLYESQTRYNVFSVFGGVREVTWVRAGRLRCQGPFSHPIIAGVFWASLMPLFAALWWHGKRGRGLAALGVTSGFVIVYCTSSSTPALALVAGFIGAGMFVARGKMRYVVWSSIGVLVALHLVMQAPVWHLIARVSAVGGSTGWHRYHLIDAWINHFTEWAATGVKTTGHWGWGLQDVTNQYILYAVTGGLATLVLFIWLLIAVFRSVGITVQRVDNDRPRQILAWSVGVMLFVHCTSFLGVGYFGQANLIWYLSLAIAVSMYRNLACTWESQTKVNKTAEVHSDPPRIVVLTR